ncbi:lipase/acyltransferase domain-containing protein [Pseudobacteroides cellulosolvens]|uniref:Lecithin:cholesterol acyltransferase n=1 Tax=Pseudobacteroides cellulosolvens ATCC 35603 = DSM 2933 TaxID=398512 RepID=A0A0L6JGB5_9FIRM|nr:hypothetical protein [Pseudobacteroides cellulosolvens]KNY24763.1 Lecithin:cholesterol acyltransferase [Pseudobacteroides cellulosolvens ATCC 35603 = DSM 2933]
MSRIINIKGVRQIIAFLVLLTVMISNFTIVRADNYYKKGIIVIPGHIGTRLYEGSTKVWPPQAMDPYIDSNGNPTEQSLTGKYIAANLLLPGLGTLIVNRLVEKKTQEVYSSARNQFSRLEFDTNGNPKYNITTEPSVSKDGIYGTINTYGPIMTKLKQVFESTSCEVCFFPYDWRLSFEETAKKLQEFINNKGFDSVTLVAHSAGGLVAAGYLALSEDNRKKVETLFNLGTPNFGIPKPFEVMQSGNYFGNELDDIFRSQFKEFSRYTPSTYYLLPSRKYIDYVGKYMSHINKAVYPNGTSEITETTFLDFNETTEQIKKESFISANSAIGAIFDDAIRFQDSLFINGTYVLNMVDTHLIEGGSDGKTFAVSTLNFLKRKYTYKSDGHSTLLGYRTPIYDSFTTTSDCDGTIPSGSARAGGLVSNITTYKNVMHMDLPKTPEIIIQIIETIKAKSNKGYAWISGSIPSSASTGADYDSWNWVDENPKALKNRYSHQSSLYDGMHQHYFYNSSNKILPYDSQVLYCNVFIDPANPPKELMLQWNDGSWEHRAYWGEDKINFGTNGSVSRRYMGPLPKTGMWIRLEVPVQSVGLGGRTISGMAFTLYGGRVTWGEAGIMDNYTLNNAPTATSCYFDNLLTSSPISSISENSSFKVHTSFNTNPSIDLKSLKIRIYNPNSRSSGYTVLPTITYQDKYKYIGTADIDLAALRIPKGTYILDCISNYKKVNSNTIYIGYSEKISFTVN